MSRRDREKDVVRLDGLGLVLLAVGLTATLLYFGARAWKTLVPAPESAPESDPDIAAERESVAAPFQVVARLAADTAEDGETRVIEVACETRRDALVGAMKNALLDAFEERSRATCHHVRVVLDGFTGSGCEPAAEGHFCKAGRIIDGSRRSPWDLRIRLLRDAGWAAEGLGGESDVERLCESLRRAKVCPWSAADDEEKVAETFAHAAGVSVPDARRAIDLGRRLMSARDEFVQELR